MEPRLIEVRPLPTYRLWIRFSDGAEGVVDVSHLGGRGVFKSWLEPGFFEKATISPDAQTVTWPGELDFDPDVLNSKATGKKIAGSDPAA